MLLEILLALILGIGFGIITGLIPGIHVNLIAILLISLSAYLLEFVSVFSVAIFIFSMALTHTFLDMIPSIFLGAPNEDTALAVLPGHRMLLDGIGYEAIRLATIGSLMSLLAGVVLLPVFIVIIPSLYNLLQHAIGWILLSVVVIMIIKEKADGKFWGSLVFLFSGMLGVLVFNLPIEQPLFPLLSGMFGISTLLLSINDGAVLPMQYITQNIRLPFRDYVKGVSAAVLSGWLTSMLPGLGSAQAAILARMLFTKISQYLYIVIIGGINTVNFLLSLVTFYTIKKARNGGVVAIKQLLEGISLPEVLVFFVVALIVGGTATLLTLFIAKRFVQVLGYLHYETVCCTVVLFIIILTIALSGFLGIVVLLLSTAIGILPPLLNVKRSLAMGCLLMPVIGYFLL